jgi:hypothetical protein
MNNKLSAFAAMALVFVSLAMFLHTYSAYRAAKHVTQPSIEALSPETTIKRVLAEVVPALPDSGAGLSGKLLVQALAEQASSIHNLSMVQAHMQVRMAGIQSVAWGAMLLLSAWLVARLLPRRKSAA